jgi:uncharacterized repeat protein (TIGR01451 family)
MTYNVVVSNAGPDTPTVTLTDVLPSGVTLVDFSSNQGTCSAKVGTVTCSLGAVFNTKPASVNIFVSLPLSFSGQTITNQASISSSLGDPNTSNNSFIRWHGFNVANTM